MASFNIGVLRSATHYLYNFIWLQYCSTLTVVRLDIVIMQERKMTKIRYKNNVWLRLWGKSVIDCVNFWSPIVSYNQTITYRHDSLQRYYMKLLSWILVPSGAFEVLSPKNIRQHQQKAFAMLSGFWPLWGWGFVWICYKSKIRGENIFCR